jgi:hypothetical protein
MWRRKVGYEEGIWGGFVERLEDMPILYASLYTVI